MIEFPWLNTEILYAGNQSGTAGCGLGFRFPRGRHGNAIDEDLCSVNSDKLIGA